MNCVRIGAMRCHSQALTTAHAEVPIDEINDAGQRNGMDDLVPNEREDSTADACRTGTLRISGSRSENEPRPRVSECLYGG